MTFPTARLLMTFSYALRASSKAYTESMRCLILPMKVRRGRLEEWEVRRGGSKHTLGEKLENLLRMLPRMMNRSHPIQHLPSQQRGNLGDRAGRNHSPKASFGTSEPFRTESVVPKESKGGEEARGLVSTRNVDSSGLDIGFGVGVQRGASHPERIDDGVEFIRAEAFSKSFVKRGRGVIDSLRGYA